MFFNTIKTTLISLEEKGAREPQRLRTAVIECSHTHALKELLTETCLCGVLLIHMWGKGWTLCVLKPHRVQSNLSLRSTHTQSHCLHTCSLSVRNRYNNTGRPLKTLPLLISSLNACVCVFTFTCMEIFFLGIIWLSLLHSSLWVLVSKGNHNCA